MLRRTMLKGVAAIAAAGVFTRHAGAQEVLKMGISIPMTGAGFNAVGRQLAAAIKLYVQQHGDIVAGRKSKSSCVTTAALPTLRAASSRR